MTQAGFLFDEFDCYHIKEKTPLPRRRNDRETEEFDVSYGIVPEKSHAFLFIYTADCNAR